MHQGSSFEMSPTSDMNSSSSSRVPESPSRYAMSPRPSARMGPLNLTMSQIITATDNFSDSNQIGEGGFGIVYKGTLEDGQVVAIKRAKKVLCCIQFSILFSFFFCQLSISLDQVLIRRRDVSPRSTSI